MDIKEIQNLIKFVAKSGASEVKLKIKDVKITIKTGSGTTETTIVQAAPMQGMPQVAAPTIATPVAQQSAQPVSEDSKYITIKSPIIGTFYKNHLLISQTLQRLVQKLRLVIQYVLLRL